MEVAAVVEDEEDPTVALVADHTAVVEAGVAAGAAAGTEETAADQDPNLAQEVVTEMTVKTEIELIKSNCW